MQTQLVLRGYLLLIRIDWLLRLGSLQRVLRLAHGRDVYRPGGTREIDIETVCHAMDVACVFYFKRVLCLQRSVATALLLRQLGHGAELVLGVQTLPFKSHAWVEIGGVVVNDKSYLQDIYQVLERY